ncbi:glycosyltransferase family 2 protein [Anabaena sp. FACHB-709]|uniref:Glycosyltransferase n=2 Tax=Nostocaceae TaxID=1162 RepID=A0ABR7ZFD4_ANACY|nr:MULTISPECIES: glycosyltransferase [Nostocaceae]BAY70801.1 putative glycosyl transferase [Trichormus variabilis NIES-23]HBW30497.1 glycosyl transferase family 2 [Nostoc sp. UBA8866]MBD2171210.1 glycosyltransferase [Anabaena cylindrica FACHB-318]MBD2263120.1 glycosyltransferase [Anabaena sp. FACHB-709]MBD2272537.1 glycosyltransferase [Nostoc sp. PCC 7120 = FACHB-418]
MSEAIVTIVVVPRERFSCTQASLESIYEHTKIPFKLIYVDGNSPTKVRKYLQKQAQEKNFQLIRTDYYLSPNHARNIGLSHVDTKYLVFLDNDVIVSPGWLQALVNCAETTGATVVGPLMCEKEPIHERIHFAGGESHIVIDVKGRRHLREKMYKQGHQVSELRSQLQQTETELAEFHCTLIRREIFEQIGYLDEEMLNTKEHLDFCMNVIQAGGKVYFEPDSLVTYVPGPPLEWSDLHFYMLRWSDAWTLASLQRIRAKWNLSEDGYFQTKYKKLGVRRVATIIKPFVRQVSFGNENKPLKRFLKNLDRKLNRFLTDRYTEMLPQRKLELPIIKKEISSVKEFTQV